MIAIVTWVFEIGKIDDLCCVETKFMDSAKMKGLYSIVRLVTKIINWTVTSEEYRE